jgi:hypothetical protein
MSAVYGLGSAATFKNVFGLDVTRYDFIGLEKRNR